MSPAVTSLALASLQLPQVGLHPLKAVERLEGDVKSVAAPQAPNGPIPALLDDAENVIKDRLERVEEEDTAKAKEVRTILATKQAMELLE